MKVFTFSTLATLLGLGLAACDRGPVAQAEAAPRQQQSQQRPSQEGEASFYGPQFSGRPMANGERFNPNSNSAAHRSLPLGTTARVTNLENGRSVTVKVKDRGPYARGRIIDVSPRSAEDLGMKKSGTAPVRVTPIEVPKRDEKSGGNGRTQQADR